MVGCFQTKTKITISLGCQELRSEFIRLNSHAAIINQRTNVKKQPTSDLELTMSEKRFRCVLLFGAPGVGKGTQGKIMGGIPGFFHLAVGDVFRSIDINSPTGKEVAKYVSEGKLVPNELTIKIWKKALDAYVALSWYKPWEDLLILDGLPRNVEQAELTDNDLEVLKLVHLVCNDEEETIQRIKRRAIRENRADDGNVDVIRHRFEVYKAQTRPVIQYYKTRNPDLTAEIDATGSPAEVFSQTLKAVIPCQNFCFTNPW